MEKKCSDNVLLALSKQTTSKVEGEKNTVTEP